MATAQQIKAEITAAKQTEATAKKAYEDFELPPGAPEEQFNKKEELRKVYEAAKKERERIEKPIKDAEKNLARTRKSISQAENVAKNPASREAALRQLESLRAEETRLTQFLEGGADQTTVTTTPTRRRGQTAPQGPVARPEFATPREFEMATAGPATAPKPKPSTGRVRRPGAGKVTPPRVVDWEPKFREMFPTQAWLLDLDRTKYADVFKLFQTAIDTRMYETQEGLQRFAAQLDNTSFYKELATTGKAREIRNLVGDLGFDTVPFNKFLTTSMNMGWEGDTLRQEVYKEAFRKDVATGQYVNPTAVKRVKASNPYLSVKAIGSAFFSTVDDNTVEQRLTGGLTDDDVVRQQRELAKGKYAHLAPLLDQGLTLEGIASSYRSRASALLEKNENEIDMGSADFSKAFNYGEEGKKRMMSDGEWEILLRSDSRFGWNKTQNAKQEARDIAASIAQAFGRVL